MQDDHRNDDPKQVWQNQQTEKSTMTLEMIQLKAQELRTKTRRELLANTASTVVAIAVSAIGIAWTHDLELRLAFTLTIAWALTGQHFLHRGMWTGTKPGDAPSIPGLEFYRQEVKRRRNLFGRVLQWSLGPMVLSLGAWILVLTGIAKNQGRTLDAVLPFCTVSLLWVAATFVLRSQNQRELRREIEQLNQIDRESSR